MNEELKKEWEIEFEVRYKSNENYVFDEVTFLDLKSFISSLLAKQQEEFVKILDDVGLHGDFDSKTVHLAEFGYNQCIADIKSKLNKK